MPPSNATCRKREQNSLLAIVRGKGHGEREDFLHFSAQTNVYVFSQPISPSSLLHPAAPFTIRRTSV